MTNGNVFVRKDVATLTDNEMASLREGFRVLRQRSANNPNSPLGWLGQANIHRDACAHANWWFLPWHRGYIYYFERILREAANDPSLTLPYWNWTENPRLPDGFRGANNPLNDDTREIGRDDRANPRFVGPPVIRGITGTRDFFTFAGGATAGPRVNNGAGNLEFQPHNYIHNFVGGNNGNMQDPDRAARDPIFWLHHANVDRLWTRWVRKNPGRTTTSQNWRQQAFSYFDTQGNPVTITTAEMLNTFDLDYRYDTQSPSAIEVGRTMAAAEFGPDEEPRGESLFQTAAPERSVISSEPVTVTLTPSARLQEGTDERMIMAEDVAQEATTLRLEVQGVAPPGNPSVGVLVFLNMPEADASTPPDDPHYVASFSFFQHEGESGEEHEHGPTTYYINATPAIRRLQEAGEYTMGDPLQTTLVIVPIAPDDQVEDVEIPFEGLAISAHG